MTETTDTIQSFAAYPTASGGVPIGTILPYGGPVSGSSQGTLETQGYLFCDGTAISRSDYSALFSVIGNAFGAGNNVDTFNLPDLRGLFLRGVDGGSGKDPDTNSRTAFAPGGSTGDQVGSYQGDAFASHNHVLPYNNSPQSKGDNGGRLGFIGDPKQNSEDTGGSETRPKNIYVNYIIKAKNV